MDKKTIIFILTIFIALRVRIVSANDFPSLLVANATLAIILDHEYLDKNYQTTLDGVKVIVERILRENLRENGLAIKYFSWTQIKFNKDFTAVISISDCKNSWRTYYEAKLETLLYVAITDADCPRFPATEGIMIPILNIGDELPQVILDTRSSTALTWKTTTLLYDEIFDRDSISRVINALSAVTANKDSSSMTIAMFKISNVQSKNQQLDTRNVLETIPIQIGKTYITITSNPDLIINLAKELGLLTVDRQWLFILNDMNNVKNNLTSLLPIINEGSNIAFAVNKTIIENCNNREICHFEEILTFFVDALIKLIQEEDSIYGQISDEEWESIRLSKKERRDRLLEYIQIQLKINPMCSRCSKWAFKAIETWGAKHGNSKGDNNNNNSNNNTDFKIIDTGFWEPTNGMTSLDAMFPHIEHGFRSKNLPVNPPWQIINYDENGNILSMAGVVINILNELSRSLNFTYFIVKLPMDHTGLTNSNYRNDSFVSTLTIPSEITNRIKKNKVFLGAAAVTIIDNFVAYMNYTIPITVQSYSLLVARPKELSRLYLFTAPFALDTWIYLCIVILIVSPILYLVNYISPYNSYLRLIKKGGLYKISNCFWYIYGALLQQGGLYLPKADSGRLIIGTWWLVVLVIVTTYCGNLVAFLTFPKIEKPISTINQLLYYGSKTITWGFKADTYIEKYLQETDSVRLKGLLKDAIIHRNESSEIIKDVKFGKHVLIDWRMNLQYIMKREYLNSDTCDFGVGIEEFLSERIALLVPLNSPYLTIINKEINRMLQMGFIQKWLKEYLPKKDRCWNPGQSFEIENHTVNLIDMQGCFLVLFIGICAAILIALIEFYFNYRNRSKKSVPVKIFTD